MSLRPCLEAHTLGCRKLVRSGRCVDHQRLRNRAKNSSPAAAVYADARWRRARKQAIIRAGRRCQALLDDRTRCPATSGLQGHHDYRGGVEQMLRDGADPFEVERIVVLCGRHHGQVSAWEQRRRRS